MLCKIADLYVEIPAAGGMDRRCSAYIAEENRTPDIVIEESAYIPERNEGLGYDDMCYMDSSRYFYWELPEFGGLMLIYANIPGIIVSVGHGPAYGKAGKGTADAGTMIDSMHTVYLMAKKRLNG